MIVSELMCPDCGGVVGATETTEAGPPCRCFIPTPEKEKSDAAVDGVPIAPPAKICRICGKDVAGHRRVRDQYGYYCYECSKEQEKIEHQGRVRCRVCGHLTREESLTDYEGTKMCPKCNRERIEAQKQVIKRIGFKGARTREEIRQIRNIAIVLGVLLIVMLYGAWRMWHR